MFIIGNVKDSNTANEISRTVSTPNKNAKIYGVKFNAGGAYNPGVGLYDAKNLNCQVSYIDESAGRLVIGQDDFNIPGSPFDIKYVKTYYDPTTNKQVVYSVEGDADFYDYMNTRELEDINGQGPGQLWVRFPKFYYKRPGRNVWLVSSDPVEGFSPSPMHYRNGKLYNYAYVSFDYLKSCFRTEEDKNNNMGVASAGFSYDYNKNDSHSYIFGSLDNQTNATGFTPGIKTWMTLENPSGFYLYDYCAHASILMLMLIKHRTTNIHQILGYHAANRTTASFTYTGTGYYKYMEDGNFPKSTVLTHNGTTVAGSQFNICMGLYNFWSIYPLLLDGIYVDRKNEKIYMTEDIEANATNYSSDFSTLTTLPHIKQTTLYTLCSNAHAQYIGGFQYNNEYPYAFLPSSSSGTKSSITEACFTMFKDSTGTNTYMTPVFTRGCASGNISGGFYGFWGNPLSFYCDHPRSGAPSAMYGACRGIFFSD